MRYIHALTSFLLIAAAACGGSQTQENPPEKVEPTPSAKSPAPPEHRGASSAAAASVAPPKAGPLTVDSFSSPPDTGSVNSYLLQSDTELIVIDGQMVVPAAKGLIEKIKATKKTPKAFFLTHAHPDHYLGFSILQDAFPSVPIYATPGVKTDYDAASGPTLEAMKKMLGENAPTKVAALKALEGPLELGGEKLEVTEMKGGEHGVSAIIRVPSLNIVFAGDHLYHEIHNWMKECDAKTWIAHLENWKKGDTSTVFYPGHGVGKGGMDLIDANLAYIRGYEAEVALAKGKDEAAVVADAKKRVIAKFPNYKATVYLDWTMGDYVKCTKKASKK